MPSDAGFAEALRPSRADAALTQRYDASRAAGLGIIPNFRLAVKDLVVVASSSRGGSSLLAELLRRSTSVLSLRGEVSPFLALRGLSFPKTGSDSDALSEADAANASEAVEALEADLASDCGAPTDVLETDEDTWRFAAALTCRLTLQWPTVAFDLEEVHSCVREALSLLQRTMDWQPGRFQDTSAFHAVFLSRLVKRVPEVNPFYYDIDRGMLEFAGVTARPRLGPPSSFLIEEPPFIAITPWKSATLESLATQPLVIKTPSNVYRLDFLQKFFPNAKLRIVHLTRNAAASINGLYEGWRYGGFFSHSVPERLNIRGYSDQFPEWGDHWWKFDLPPGWRAHVSDPLERVCSWQWQSAHAAILRYLDEHRFDASRVHRLLFEDVVSTETRGATLRGLMEWITNRRTQPASDSCSKLPVVMATYPPQPARWRKRAEMIGPLLEEPGIRETMTRLGYHGDPSEWG